MLHHALSLGSQFPDGSEDVRAALVLDLQDQAAKGHVDGAAVGATPAGSMQNP